MHLPWHTEACGDPGGFRQLDTVQTEVGERSVLCPTQQNATQRISGIEDETLFNCLPFRQTTYYCFYAVKLFNPFHSSGAKLKRRRMIVAYPGPRASFSASAPYYPENQWNSFWSPSLIWFFPQVWQAGRIPELGGEETSWCIYPFSAAIWSVAARECSRLRWGQGLNPFLLMIQYESSLGWPIQRTNSYGLGSFDFTHSFC